MQLATVRIVAFLVVFVTKMEKTCGNQVSVIQQQNWVNYKLLSTY